MIFLKIDPNKELLAIITGIVSAYLASRDPKTNLDIPQAKKPE